MVLLRTIFGPAGHCLKLNSILIGLSLFLFSNELWGEPLGIQSAPLWLRYPSISPDGKNIAFSFEGHLFIVPSAGGDAQPLSAGPAHDTAPVWSPDGRLIAFASDRYGHYNVFLMGADGGPSRRLTSYSNDEIPTGFTPGGLVRQIDPIPFSYSFWEFVLS
jgi:tricorn protease